MTMFVQWCIAICRSKEKKGALPFAVRYFLIIPLVSLFLFVGKQREEKISWLPLVIWQKNGPAIFCAILGEKWLYKWPNDFMATQMVTHWDRVFCQYCHFLGMALAILAPLDLLLVAVSIFFWVGLINKPIQFNFEFDSLKTLLKINF